MSIYDTYANNHPTTLLHRTLSQAYGCRAYQLLCEAVDPELVGGKSRMAAGLMIHRVQVAMVIGESGRYAKERAGKIANDELHGLTPAEFRAKYDCDCKSSD
jgi:endoribonuclease Dicer